MLAAVAAILVATPAASPSNGGLLVGFADALPEYNASAGSAESALGASVTRFTLQWTLGQTTLTPGEQSTLAAGVSAAGSMRVVLSVYGTSSATPTDASSRHDYCTFAANAVQQNPSIHDVIVWNEPNKTQFWSPQQGAPAAYEALLAQCYDTLHPLGVNVLGFALSHDGADTSASTSPGAFIRNAGTAYRDSGRTSRIFDTVDFHPYPATSLERPWAKHVGSTMIGEGDWNKLMYNLWQAFEGTGQPIPGESDVTIWYTEVGFQTTVPAAETSLYSGTENVATLPEDAGGDTSANPAAGSPAPDQATQIADAVSLAACQPYVSTFLNFLVADESALTGWQSGPLYPDLSHKASYGAFAQAFAAASSGTTDCSSLKGGAPSADYLPPTAPTGLSGTATSTVQLAWQPASDTQSPITYRIYRDGGLIGTSTVPSYTDAAVSQLHTYSYTIRAIDSASNLGPAATAVQVTTPDTTAPLAPTALAGTAGSDGVALSWQAATDNVGVTGYDVSRDGEMIGTTAGTTFDDASAPAASSLGYTVVALDAAGNRSPAATVSVQTPSAPAPAAPAPAAAAPAPATSGGGGGGGATPNIALAGTASVAAPAGGSTVVVHYTLTDENRATATKLALVVILPPGLAYAGSQVERGPGCVQSGGQVSCDLAYLSADVPSTNVWVFAKVTDPVAQNLVATATSDLGDLTPGDNTITIALAAPPSRAAAPSTSQRPKAAPRRFTGTRHRDVMRGTKGDDILIGLRGNDDLTGLGGHDILIGGPGNDTIHARDGLRDVVNCGAGSDLVYADRKDVVAKNCEVVRR